MAKMIKNGSYPGPTKPVGLCNHRSPILVDPTETQLRRFEAILAACPNCSRWVPGDGPIMAIINTHPNLSFSLETTDETAYFELDEELIFER